MPKKSVLVSTRVSPVGTIEVYEEFDGSVRKTVMTNEKNRSNWKTITKYVSAPPQEMVLKSSLEMGAEYVTYSLFDKNGQCVCTKRTNRKKGSVYRMEILLSNENGHVAIIDYNGEKSVTFVLKNIRENVRIQQPKGFVRY